MKLHIGAGSSPIAGWTNVDILPYPGVDAVLDVTQGLPFTDVEMIFAEHFLEHLTLVDGLRFLAECRRALNEDGVLRVSTPNLDWVWLTHYKQPADMTPDEQLLGCLEINRAFHGWGHRFLYNRHTLRSALERSGFREFLECAYGRSTHAALNGLERHELSDGLRDSPSVLIVEASGRLPVEAEPFDTAIAPYVRDFGTT
jgi:predicted SAM-dependent methyltransferase